MSDTKAAVTTIFSADHITANAIKDANYADDAEKMKMKTTTGEEETNIIHSFRGSLRNLGSSIRNVFFDWPTNDPEIKQMEDAENIVSTDHIVENLKSTKEKENYEAEEEEEEEEEDDDGAEHFHGMKKKTSSSSNSATGGKEGVGGTAADNNNNMRGSFARLSNSTRKGWFDW